MRKYKTKTLQTIHTDTYLIGKGVESELTSHFKYNESTYGFDPKCPICIEACGITNANPDYSIKRKGIFTYVIEYIISGKGFVNIDDKKFTVEKGDVYILEPGHVHDYGADKNEPYTKIWVNFHGKIFGEMLKTLKLKGINYFPKTDIYSNLQKICKFENFSLYSEEVFSMLYEELQKILLKLYEQKYLEKNQENKGISDIKRYIDERITKKITVNQVAKHFKITTAAVNYKFKSVYRITPYQYILNKKIDLAKIYLQNHNIPIKNISNELGFYDYYAFSKAFKKTTGFSPRKYRANK